MGEPQGESGRRASRFARAAGLSVASVVLTLLCLGAFAGAAFSASFPAATTEAGAGSLTLEASTEETNPGSSLTVRVANDGAGPVTAVELSLAAPEGVEATITPDRIPTLPAQASVLAVVSLSGAPTTGLRRVEVMATGASASGRTGAVASIEIAPIEPAVTMTIAGNTRLTDASPADLVVVLRNAGVEEVAVSLRGSAGQHTVRLARDGEDLSQPGLGREVDLQVPGRSSALVQARVEAAGPVRRGAAALVMTAQVIAPDARYDVSATQSLDTTLSTDVLPGIVGIGSVLFVPGLAAVWVWLAVRSREERRRGLAPSSPASQIFDNKLWLLAAAALSVAAAFGYSRLGFTNLFDTYALWDIVQLSLVCGVLSFVIASVVVMAQSRGVPTLERRLDPIVALEEAGGFSDGNERSVYKTTDDKLGLLVKTLSDDVLVLSPPIWFTELDEVGTALSRGASLSDVVTILAQQEGYRAKVIYAQDAETRRYISQPVAVRGAVPTGQAQVPILAPHDFDPLKEASTAP